EGVLGEMGQRMRALFDSGQFSEGLNAGVQHLVNAMAQKLAINIDDLAAASRSREAPNKISEPTPENTPGPPQKATDEVGPATTAPSKTDEVAAPVNPPARRGSATTRGP